MTELSWRWIALMLTAPPLIGWLVAQPLWKKGEMILGNLAGTILIFSAGVGLIVRESVELNSVTARCIDAGYTCWPVPGAFVRYSIYAAIALIEVVVLFSWSLRVERQMRNRHYAPEWR